MTLLACVRDELGAPEPRRTDAPQGNQDWLILTPSITQYQLLDPV
ncbi:hypothetical protein [Streptomyces chartreusis]